MLWAVMGRQYDELLSEEGSLDWYAGVHGAGRTMVADLINLSV